MSSQKLKASLESERDNLANLRADEVLCSHRPHAREEFLDTYHDGFDAAMKILMPVIDAAKNCLGGHHEDCADSREEFGPNETCECGYAAFENALVSISSDSRGQ